MWQLTCSPVIELPPNKCLCMQSAAPLNRLTAHRRSDTRGIPLQIQSSEKDFFGRDQNEVLFGKTTYTVLFSMKTYGNHCSSLKKWKVGKMKHPSYSFTKMPMAGWCGIWGRYAWLTGYDSQMFSDIALLRVPEAARNTRALTVKTGNNQWHCQPT